MLTAYFGEASLAEIRNKQAHGDPFDGLAYGGLLELVRDLIAYAYRDFIRDGQRGPLQAHLS
jgi:hypothetical protein